LDVKWQKCGWDGRQCWFARYIIEENKNPINRILINVNGDIDWLLIGPDTPYHFFQDGTAAPTWPILRPELA
jgi:hypothetical protein